MNNKLLEVKRTLYRKSFYHFYKEFCFPLLEPGVEFLDNWHVKLLCDRLQQEVERMKAGRPRTKDLIVALPFRSAKSLICTIAFPVYAWLVMPSMGFIACSSTATLSRKLSLKSRDIIESPEFKVLFPELKLRDDKNAIDNYGNNYRGFRASTSVGGSITGDGGHCIIVDDPLDASKVASAAEVQAANEYYSTTLYSRVNNFERCFRLIIAQRLHENDLIGYLLKKSPEQYDYICVPATADDPSNIHPPELISYYRDGLFWSNRFSRKVLKEIHESMGSLAYSQQLLQKPVPSGGSIFKKAWFENHVITYKAFLEICGKQKPTYHFYIDTAQTKDLNNDTTGIAIAAQLGKILYIMDVISVRKELPELLRYLKEELIPEWYSDGSKVHVEGKSNGKDLMNFLRLDGFRCVELQTGRDGKEVRAKGVTPDIEGGLVYLVESANTPSFLEELFTFPLSTIKDRVDAFVYACASLKKSNADLSLGFA